MNIYTFKNFRECPYYFSFYSHDGLRANFRFSLLISPHGRVVGWGRKSKRQAIKSLILYTYALKNDEKVLHSIKSLQGWSEA